jgi:hypothetical protein
MNKITQTMLFGQSLIKYSQKNGVTKAAIKYKTTDSTFTDGYVGMMERYHL